MKPRRQWQLVAGLALAIGLPWQHNPVEAAAKGPRPAFTIHTRNYAGVASGTLAEAQRVATAIFHDAGIEVRWSEIDVSAGRVQRARAQAQPMTLADIQINILSDAAAIPAGVSANVMGVAPGVGPDRTIVDVFEGRVRARFGKTSAAYSTGDMDRRVSEGQLLGHVIAHEVGHLLLNQEGHSPRGIMRGEWSFGDFWDMTFGVLMFTPQQAQVLRAEVARRTERGRADIAAAELPSVSR